MFATCELFILLFKRGTDVQDDKDHLESCLVGNTHRVCFGAVLCIVAVSPIYGRSGDTMNHRNGWFFLLASVLSILGIIGVVTRGYQQVVSQDVPESVTVGYDVWRRYSCEGCHTLYGQGGVYAPDLTHILSIRSESYIREFVVNPAAFYPNHRVMPRYGLKQEEVTGLLAMFRWMDQDSLTVGYWPPRDLSIAQNNYDMDQLAAEISIMTELEQGRQIFGQRCASCHSLEPDTIIVGPSLWDIGTTAASRVPGTEPAEYIRTSIIAPSELVVEGFQDVMQKNFGNVLSSAEIDDLVAFLLSIGPMQGE